MIETNKLEIATLPPVVRLAIFCFKIDWGKWNQLSEQIQTQNSSTAVSLNRLGGMESTKQTQTKMVLKSLGDKPN